MKFIRSEQHEHQRRELWLREFNAGIEQGFTTSSVLDVADKCLAEFDCRFSETNENPQIDFQDENERLKAALVETKKHAQSIEYALGGDPPRNEIKKMIRQLVADISVCMALK